MQQNFSPNALLCNLWNDNKGSLSHFTDFFSDWITAIPFSQVSLQNHHHASNLNRIQQTGFLQVLTDSIT